MEKIIRFFKFSFFYTTILFTVFPLYSEEVSYPYQKGGFLYFQGEGKANPSVDNKTQKRSLSQEAAILEGKAKIAFYIDGLKTKKNLLVKEAKTKDKKIELKVKMFLKGVQVVEARWDEADNCKALLKINKKDLLRKLKVSE